MTELQPKENTMSKIIDFDPSKGQAFQGDVAIMALPANIVLVTDDEIQPIAGRLILQEGEVTGHHHAIVLGAGRSANFRTEGGETSLADALSGASPALRSRLSKQKAARIAPAVEATAKLYRDPLAAAAMVTANLLDRADLCVGFLRVNGGPMVVTHDEHDGIRLPPGDYYVGRQIESAGAEERVVAD